LVTFRAGLSASLISPSSTARWYQQLPLAGTSSAARALGVPAAPGGRRHAAGQILRRRRLRL